MIGRCLVAATIWVVGFAGSGSAQVPDTLDLPTAIAFAVDNNFAIKQARERIREQEGLIVEVKSQVLPNASLSSSYTRQADELAGDGNSNQSWNISLQVRQLLYSGGGVSAALDAQRFVREAALLDLKTVIHDEILGVRTRFYDVLLAREQITVQEQNVALLEEQLATARNRFEAGAVSNFDVLRAEVELANAQPPLIRARNNLRTSIDLLRLSIGFGDGAGSSVSAVPEFIGSLTYEPAEFDLLSALGEARANRPELSRLAVLVDARDAGVTIARSGFKPSLEAIGGYQLRKAGFSESFGDSLDGWNVGVQSNWAIFDGKATRARVNQAESQQAQARIQLDQATLSVEVEVRNAFSSLNEAVELADAASRVVEQAEEALRLANARYGAGTATQLELLSAQVALTRARDNQLQANYSHNVAVANLRRSMGLSDVLFAE